MNRLEPRQVERFGSPDDSYRATLWGLLWSSRAPRAVEIIDALLAALRAHADELDHIPSFQWAFVTGIRADFDESDRALAAFILHQLGLIRSLGWGGGSQNYSVDLDITYLELTQQCQTAKELWEMRSRGDIPLPWPTCPSRPRAPAST